MAYYFYLKISPCPVNICSRIFSIDDLYIIVSSIWVYPVNSNKVIMYDKLETISLTKKNSTFNILSNEVVSDNYWWGIIHVILRAASIQFWSFFHVCIIYFYFCE